MGLAALALQPASADPLPARNGFPSQTVKFISPFPPGGGNDATARLVTTRLPEIMGQAAVVDNRGGAGGNIGAKAVADAKPDGYTLLTSQVSIMAVNPTLYASGGLRPDQELHSHHADQRRAARAGGRCQLAAQELRRPGHQGQGERPAR
jgi:tripartite-type tricarboxylate transporter receptor subunit TctC